MRQIRFASSLVLALFGLYLMYQSRPQKNPSDGKVEIQALSPGTDIATNVSDKKKEFPSDSDEFKVQLNKTLDNFPTTAQLQGLKLHEVHSAPHVLKSVAVEVGMIQDKIKTNKELQPLAFDFFKRCTEKSDLAMQVRALCYLKASALSEYGSVIVSKEIKDLASGLRDSQ